MRDEFLFDEKWTNLNHGKFIFTSSKLLIDRF
jgi:hypothetical protein